MERQGEGRTDGWMDGWKDGLKDKPNSWMDGLVEAGKEKLVIHGEPPPSHPFRLRRKRRQI